MSTLKSETYSITRQTLTIPKPISAVLAKLDRSLKPSPTAPPLSLTTHPTSTSFESNLAPLIGPHGFVHFQSFNHGAWLSLYPSVPHSGKQAVRVIYGNPMIALTMLKEDVRAGLHVPVDALVVERGDEGTDVVWVRPSEVIAGWEGASGELKAAAGVLDGKVEALWRWVASGEDEGVQGEGKL